MNEIAQRFHFHAPEAFVSNAFLAQLSDAFIGKPLLAGNSRLCVDPHCLLDEVEKIEGRGRARSLTGPPEQFRHNPLRGLWKKHWFQASFMARNMSNEFRRIGESLVREALKEDLRRSETEVVPFNEEHARAISYSVASAGYEKRAQRGANPQYGKLTGEWIVYAEAEGKRYYLTLALHSEDKHVVLNRCLPALTQFPEIVGLPSFSALNILRGLRAALR